MRKRTVQGLCGVFLLALLIYSANYFKSDFSLEEMAVVTESENNKVEEYKEWQLPDCETEEEMRDYFLSKHPKANSYAVYPPKEEAEDTGNIYLIDEEGCSYAYYQRAGHSYMVEVSVYQEGEKEPFQIFVTNDYYANNGQTSCYLTDINMDGYFDFEVYRHDFSRYTYVDDFVWNPSESEFVEAPVEVQAFTSREYDEETRKIYVYQSHGQGNSVEYVYQWENELDFRLVGLMETADESNNTMSFRITAYEKDGSERMILDYITDEIWEFEEFATELFYENVLSEKSIKSEEVGAQYQIYYVQDMTEMGEYEERIYVIDENLQPVTMIEESSTEAYEDMLWTMDEQLHILYIDGNIKSYALKELLTQGKK